MEDWKGVNEYPGRYEVSSLGRIRSVKTGRIRKPHVARTGYLIMALHRDRDRKTYRIHRLVAQEFIPNPDRLPQVNHKDGDKLNNCVANLEWMTAAHNIQHYYENHYEGNHRGQNQGASNGQAKLAQAQVGWVIQLSGAGYSQYSLSEIFNVSRSQIRNILTGKKWAHLRYP